MRNNHVVVVGAELGGLTVAAYLAKFEFVFERNNHPGVHACRPGA